MNDNTEWVTLDDTAFTNTTPGSNRDVTINTTSICPNMTNKEFRRQAMRARDIGVELIKKRIEGLARWDTKEQDRVTTFFASADVHAKRVLSEGLPRLLAAMQQLEPERIVRWDSETNRHLSCAVTPDSGVNHAAVCKPDSEKPVIAIYSKFCESPFAQLWGICKVKTIIHECTHFTDTFNSQDHMYLDSEAGAMIFARNKPHQAISNADSIAGYIATFDGVNIAP
ncbi:M35 family metallo-endopeptidase [Paraburkholderia tuberum]|uniref:Lysine-specific metallo-endopeptidase n=1 Tax=Paraburkholderia tuberum TaxID=157910 RepID=A0A1H1JDI2_9BURK|nr:M35 family metallo-endopeptidase [Paraburkholderia tuberum]SDR48049.1 Lysine-specific metallo-endopeptidase [Paraburkholderia tuberum]